MKGDLESRREKVETGKGKGKKEKEKEKGLDLLSLISKWIFETVESDVKVKSKIQFGESSQRAGARAIPSG